MKNLPYPVRGRLSAQEVGSEEDAGIINVPNSEVPEVIANAPHPSMVQVHQITVNGKIEEVTTAQLIEKAQKGDSAEARFQEAASVRKENADALAVYEDLKSFFDDEDVDAFRRVGQKMGVDPEQIELAAKQAFADDNDDDDRDVIERYEREKEVLGTRSRKEAEAPIDYSRLAPDVQRALRRVEESRMKEIITEALDKDEVIRYNMDRRSPEGQAAIRKLVDEKIQGQLAKYNGDFGDGTQILADILPDVRTHLQALGIPDNSRGPLGLGTSPGGGGTEVYPTKKPDHVSSSEGDAFEQNILETLAYHQVNSERGKQ